MAQILNDYKCPIHGYFESYSALCPKGCMEGVMIVHLQAPGVMSEKTKKNDKTLQQLSMDYGMTDIKSTREGENQAGYLVRNNKDLPEELKNAQKVKESRPGDAAIWGGYKGMTMPNLVRGGAFPSIHGEQVGINPKEAGNLTGPRTASYIQDHQNLTIKK